MPKAWGRSWGRSPQKRLTHAVGMNVSLWFLIGQGRHPRRTIFIPASHQCNVQPTALHPADLVTVYMNDDNLPLPTPPQSGPIDGSTYEAESSSDLTRG